MVFIKDVWDYVFVVIMRLWFFGIKGSNFCVNVVVGDMFCLMDWNCNGICIVCGIVCVVLCLIYVVSGRYK